MATPNFPDFASIKLSGYSQKRESALLRTEMDSGIPKQAKIKTRVSTTRNATIGFASKDDYIKFEDWYANDCDEGASWFYFVDPVTKQLKTARFADGGYTAAPDSTLEGSWSIQMKIETWG